MKQTGISGKRIREMAKERYPDFILTLTGENSTITQGNQDAFVKGFKKALSINRSVPTTIDTFKLETIYKKHIEPNVLDEQMGEEEGLNLLTISCCKASIMEALEEALSLNRSVPTKELKDITEDEINDFAMSILFF